MSSGWRRALLAALWVGAVAACGPGGVGATGTGPSVQPPSPETGEGDSVSGPDAGADFDGGAPDGGEPVACEEGWMPVGGMVVNRLLARFTLLPDGRVLASGGLDRAWSKTAFASTEVFDPSTGGWAPSAPMSVERQGHTATLLEDGRVLVVGGRPSVGKGGVHVSAELYDPVRDTWTLVAPPSRAWSSHAAVRLPDGRVLVVGTSVDSSRPPEENHAELYEPASDRWVRTGPLLPLVHTYETFLFLRSDGVGVVANTGDMQLWDVRSNSWTAGPRVPLARLGAKLLSTQVGPRQVLFWNESEAPSVLLDVERLTWTEGPRLPESWVWPAGSVWGSPVLLGWPDETRRQQAWVLESGAQQLRALPTLEEAISSRDGIELQDGRLLHPGFKTSFVLNLCPATQ